MEGGLPKVFYDELGVGFVKYTGDGGEPAGDDTSVTDPLAPRLSVYPSPVRETMNIVSDVVMNEVRLINMIGQMVYAASVDDKTFQLPVGDIKEGIYLVQITAGDSVQIKRVIISR